MSPFCYAQKGGGTALIKAINKGKISVPSRINPRVTDPRLSTASFSLGPNIISPVISARPQTLLQKSIDRAVFLQLETIPHPLIGHLKFFSASLNIQRTLNQVWRDISLSPSWNFREVAEKKLKEYPSWLKENESLLDVLTLEQYMLKNQGKWPRNFKDGQTAVLAKNIAVALYSPYQNYLVSLRKVATNIPTIQETVTKSEKFIAEYKRVPGVVWLLSETDEDLPVISAEEKMLGSDLQFIVQTDIINSETTGTASTARLRDWWNCYSDIYFASGIPEVSTDGKANIPVFTTAEWQHKLYRWVHNQPVSALLYPARSYKELVIAHEQQFNQALKQNVIASQVLEFWNKEIQEKAEEAYPFDQWIFMEKEEALLNAAQQVRSVKMPQLSHEEWDQYATNWVEQKNLTLVKLKEISSIPFKELSSKNRANLIIGNIYYHHIYPEEYIAKLREANEL